MPPPEGIFHYLEGVLSPPGAVCPFLKEFFTFQKRDCPLQGTFCPFQGEYFPLQKGFFTVQKGILPLPEGFLPPLGAFCPSTGGVEAEPCALGAPSTMPAPRSLSLFPGAIPRAPGPVGSMYPPWVIFGTRNTPEPSALHRYL